MGNRSDKARSDEDGEGTEGTAEGSDNRSMRRRRRRRKSSQQSSSSEEERQKVSYWQMVRGGYNELVHAIIRPPRADYQIEVLGPTSFTVEGRLYVREDLELVNKRGLKIVCSHWRPQDESTKRPCMIYLHGNASCRAEALECLPLVLSAGMTLFALDFAGSGKSEGEYISLGWYESDDVETVVQHLRSSDHVSTIGLWGRSMGAVTALMFGDRDPTIACMVLDSPFASLKQLAKELVDHAQLSVPRFAVGIALKMVRSSVRSRAGFDINKLEPVKNADKCFIPALFGAAEGDEFIRPHHSQQIYDSYAGDKNIILFDGDHNTSRPQFFNASVGIWLHNTMLAPYGEQSGEPFSPLESLSESEIFSSFHNSYHIPSPMSPSGGGIGISVGRSQQRHINHEGSIGRDDGVNHDDQVMLDAMDDEEDYYEQAMLRHAIELSLAESSGTEQKNSTSRQPESESSCCYASSCDSSYCSSSADQSQPCPTPAPAPPPPHSLSNSSSPALQPLDEPVCAGDLQSQLDLTVAPNPPPPSSSTSTSSQQEMDEAQQLVKEKETSVMPTANSLPATADSVEQQEVETILENVAPSAFDDHPNARKKPNLAGPGLDSEKAPFKNSTTSPSSFSSQKHTRSRPPAPTRTPHAATTAQES